MQHTLPPGVRATWSPLFLYAVFVPHKDKQRRDIPEEAAGDFLKELRIRITEGIGGLIDFKIHGAGLTDRWGPENTTVVISLSFFDNLRVADDFFERTGLWIKQTLDQDDVLIIRLIVGNESVLQITNAEPAGN